MKKDELTEKQLLFVKEFVNNGGNGSQAYIAAGYSASSENVVNAAASRMLRLNKISTAVARLQTQALAKKQKQAEKLEVTQDWLITQLAQTVSDARAVNQHSTALGALMAIGKTLGLIVDKREISASLSVDSTLTQLDTAQLLGALKQAQSEPPENTIDADYREIS